MEINIKNPYIYTADDFKLETIDSAEDLCDSSGYLTLSALREHACVKKTIIAIAAIIIALIHKGLSFSNSFSFSIINSFYFILTPNGVSWHINI